MLLCFQPLFNTFPAFNHKIMRSLTMFSIGSFIARRGTRAVAPCYMMNAMSFSNFGTIKWKSYFEWLSHQALSILSPQEQGCCPQGEVLQTPVTTEALTSLRNLIEQDAHTLDKTSKQRLQRLANAAQISFAECAFLHDEIRLLFK